MNNFKLSTLACLVTSAVFSVSAVANSVTDIDTTVVKAKRPNYKTNTTNTAFKMDVSQLGTPRSVNTIDIISKGVRE